MARREILTDTTVVKLKLKEFAIPSAIDALVVGKRASIRVEDLRKALSVLHGIDLEQICLDNDEMVGDILVSSDILAKISRRKLIEIVLFRVKPLMTAAEIIQLSITLEKTIDTVL